jgi:hypothetical protein
MAGIHELTDTWNSGGTTFAAIKMNVTDSASNAASKLLELEVGGSDRFTVDKDGDVVAAGTLAVTGASTLTGAVAAGSTLAVTGATTLSSTLAVTGAVSASAAVLSAGGTGGIGYATGAGGAVTQASSRTTGVTVNKVAGAITLVSAAGSTTPASFTVTNSAVAATDTVLVCQKSGTDKYDVSVSAVGAGSFEITFNTKSGTTTEQPVFNFAVIKAVAA